jgi:hypothetical protein
MRVPYINLTGECPTNNLKGLGLGLGLGMGLGLGIGLGWNIGLFYKN